MSVRSVFDSKGLAHINVDGQHLSRLTHSEVREIVLQCIVFGGKAIRDEVRDWLNEGKIEDIAQFLAPEKEATK
jgi:hypothetical protein